MSFRWTDTLRGPLASRTREGSWDRVEPARDGAWLFLSRNGHGYGADWFRSDGRSLVALDPLRDERLPRLPPAVARWLRLGHGIRLLAWRVGSRAIFRVETVAGPRICKLFRKDRSVLRRWTILRGGDWRAPEVLDWEPRERLLTLELCPGVSLNRRWLDGEGAPGDGDRVGDLLCWLAGSRPPEDFPSHGVEDEVRVLDERLAVFERALEDPPGRATELVVRVTESLRNCPASPPVLCHRDLHDKQILLDGDRGYLIDLDLAAAGPPALDPGNILAHLRLRSLKGAEIPWRRIARRISRRSIDERGIGDSLHVWTAASLMRLALIYSRRRRGPELIARLLDSVEQALERSGEWDGLV